TNTQPVYFTGGVTGPGKLVKAGAAPINLTTSSSYAGGTELQAGSALVSNGAGLGTGPVTMAGGTELDLSGPPTSGITIANAISVQGSGVAGAGAIVSKQGLNELAGPIVLTGATKLAAPAAGLPTAPAILLSGAVSGTGPLTAADHIAFLGSAVSSYT